MVLRKGARNPGQVLVTESRVHGLAALLANILPAAQVHVEFGIRTLGQDYGQDDRINPRARSTRPGPSQLQLAVKLRKVQLPPNSVRW